MLALLFLAWIILAGLAPENDGPLFFIFLTNWSYLVWVGYLIWSAISVTVTYFGVFCCRRKKYKEQLKEKEEHRCSREVIFRSQSLSTGCCGIKEDKTFWYQKIHWVLYFLGIDITIAVVILYWVAIYDPNVNSGYDYFGGVNLMTHLINGIVALLDIFVAAIPINFLHFVYLITFSGAYSAFTGFYFIANGTNVQGEPYIYSLINYEETPDTAATLVVIISLLYYPLIHIMVYGISLLREGLLYLYKKYCCVTTQDEDKETTELY